jgi:hypothetical protein
MARWTCPSCEREFGAANQAHVCSPGISVDELLARHPDWVTEIYEAVIEPLRALGPVHEDAVNVGIFLKSDRKIAEFRPRVRSVLLHVILPSQQDHPRLLRAMPVAGDRQVHSLKLTSPDDVDDELRRWLEESYDFNTD